ncbi:MAG: hypothetical protein CFE36_09685 [Sphingomonadaceae bacterium PASS1]|nr:MAG: hypothetical protein CFE36_09685 [Sphingomonadaceae bacterium PASS1]
MVDSLIQNTSQVAGSPFVSEAIADQLAVEDTEWSHQVSANAFSDLEGDTLTYSATLGDGSPLPDWLNFDAATRTFLGTPPQNLNGDISLTVIASDGALTASDTFVLTINPVEDEATGSVAVNGTVAEGGTVSVDVNVTDVDGAITATSYQWQISADGVSGWTDLSGATLSSFAIASDQSQVGNYLRVVATTTDALGGTSAFTSGATVAIANVNDAPVLATAIFNQTAVEGIAWTYQLPANAFVDPDDNALTYGVTMQDGTPLPDWISFNAATRTLSGTAPINSLGSFNVVVTTSDGLASATDVFAINVSDVLGQLIDGTDLSETLTGTAGADVINGLGGSDIIYGRAGDDILNGGDQYDNLYGEGGNDILNSGSGGGYLDGGTGDDILNGGDGNDTLSSDAGSDVMRGGAGNDRIYSYGYGSGYITRQIEAGSGDDYVYINNGQSVNTSVDLGEGNDLIELNYYNNNSEMQITLGAGQDRVDLRVFNGALTFTDFMAGPQGDVLDWALLQSGQLFGWDGASNPFGQSGFMRLVQSGTDTLLQVDRDGSVVIPPAVPGMPGPISADFTTLAILKNVNAADLTAYNFGGFDPRTVTFLGSAADDQIIGSDRGDIIDSNAGNDSLTGGAANDALDGGTGIDIAYYSGAIGDYTITPNADGSIAVADVRVGSPDGTDTLRNVELLSFAGIAYSLDGNPLIISINGGDTASVSISENTTIVTKVVASQLNATAALTYSISGGADASLFQIDASTGDLTFKAAPNFEIPADADGNNIYDVEVQVSGASLTDRQSISVTVTNANDAPVVSTAIADQASIEDAEWSYQIPADTFSDFDSATLTYSTKLSNGSPLPASLIFDPTTLRFSGTPSLNFNGDLGITVTASDGIAAASDTFILQVNAVNDAPVVSAAIADQASLENEEWRFQLPANAFSDVDSNTLYYSALLDDGSTLPTWLTFDTATRTFSGTPPLDYLGTLNIAITASDGSAFVTDTFAISIIFNVNDAPVVSLPIPNRVALENAPWSYQVPAATFSDVDRDILTYTATLDNGSPLPAWLTFDPATRTFSGTPPLNSVGDISLKVIASDGALTSSDTFILAVTDVLGQLIDGTAGNDTLVGTAGADTINGFGGNDTINGNAGNDVIDGGAGSDTINGGSGDDTLSDSEGGAQLNGGDGNDIITGRNQVSMPTAGGILSANGGSGDDTIDFASVNGSVSGDAGNDVITLGGGYASGGDGSDVINMSGSGSVYGGEGNDTITSGSGDDYIDTGNGNDIVDSGAGNDIVYSGREYFSNSGSDTIRSGAGNDTIYSYKSIYGMPIFPGAPPVVTPNILIETGLGDDLIEYGNNGSASAVINLGEGNDRLQLRNTTSGGTQLTLGSGRDAIELYNVSIAAPLTITDFQAGPDGDSFNLSTLPTGQLFGWDGGTNPFGASGFMRLVQSGADTLLQIDRDGAANSIAPMPGMTTGFVTLAILQNVTASQLDASNFGGFAPRGITYLGSADADQFVGTTRDDVFTALAGNDTVTGAGGNDRIDGGEGIDTAVYNGSLGDYTVTTNADGSISVADNRAGNPNGSDTLVAVERINIGGTLYALDGKPLISSDGGGDTASVTVSENGTFVTTVTATDPDANTILSYSISGGADAALFDINAATGALTFKAAPNYEAPADLGGDNVYDVVVQVSDGTLTDTQAIVVTVTNAINDAQLLAAPIADQYVTEDAAWSYQVPAGTFSDPDGDALTYSANSGDGSPLPDWLEFDTATQTFSGTPPQDFNGNVSVKVTASDGSLTDSDTFVLTVSPVEDEATGSVVVNGTVAEGGTVGVDANATDIDGAIQDTTYQWQISADGVNGWTDLSGATSSSYATASDQSQVGKYLRVVATTTDALGGTTAFTSAATVAIANVNDAPVLAAVIFNQTAVEGIAWSYQLPFNAFTDPDGDALTYSVTMQDGTQLPGWISFNAATQTLSGTAPVSSTGNFSLKVTAFDGVTSESSAFTLSVSEVLGQSIDGTTQNDVLQGSAGSDLINGISGNDTINGGAGNDSLYGGTGNDRLDGGIGDDLIAGGDGDDTLFWSAGSDRMQGGAGNDLIELQEESTRLANLTIDTGSGDDQFYIYYASTADIVANLSEGNDRFFQSGAAFKSLTLTLGDGRDSVALSSFEPTNAFQITDFQVGSQGDVLQFQFINIGNLAGWDGTSNPFGAAGYVRLLQSGSDTFVQFDRDGAIGSEAFQTIVILKNVVAAELDTMNLGGFSHSSETLIGMTIEGSDADDLLNGTAAAETIFGGGGNDTIIGGLGNDSIYGGDGNDLIESRGPGSDFIDAGAGDDTIISNSAGSHVLLGGIGNDFIGISGTTTELDMISADAGAGNDRITITGLGKGNIDLKLGEGDDHVRYSVSLSVAATGNRSISFGLGKDIIEYIATLRPSSLKITDFEVGLAGDRINLSRISISSFVGWDGLSNPFAGGYLRLLQSDTDTLIQMDRDGAGASSSFETFITLQNVNAFDLTAYHFDGMDPNGSSPLGIVVDGTSGISRLSGSLGPDVIKGFVRSELIYGNAGNDTIDGGEGNDSIFGGAGDDMIYGGLGDDFLQGEGGNDIVDGGEGEDSLYWSSGSDVLRGGSGNDYILASASQAMESGFIFGNDGDDTLEITIGGTNLVEADMGMGADLVRYIYGTNVSLTLGVGKDVIEYNPFSFLSLADYYNNNFIVNDFAVGTNGDVIDFSKLAWTSFNWNGLTNLFSTGRYLRLVQSGTDTLVQFDQDGSLGALDFGTVMTLKSVNAADLVAANFAGFTPSGITYLGTTTADQYEGSNRDDTFNALGGDDTLTGGAGNDRIDGGEGLDTAVYDGSRDDYTVATNLDGSISVSDNRASSTNGTDALIGVERINIGGTLYAADGKPLITSNGGVDAAALSIAENGTAVTRVVATSLNANASLVYAISGGVDAALFQIDPATGELSFRNAPDFEVPADTGTNNIYDVEVQVSDGTNFDVQSIAVSVTNINDAPVVANAITDQSVDEDAAWVYRVPAGTFSDADGDTLIYSATSGDGSPIPTWLNFDATTRTFSGTPPLNFNGNISLTVTASDPSGLQASDTFVLTVNPVEDEATGTLTIAGTVAEGGLVGANLSANDVDGAITSTAYQWEISNDGVSGWSNLSGATSSSYAIASDQSQVGKYLRVVATTTDALGGTTAFTSAATVAIANVNDAPVLVAPIADQSATEDAAFSFVVATGSLLSLVVPPSSFADVDPGDVLTLSATLANGSPLPTWLTFNAATGTFSGTPLRGDVGAVSVRVTAADAGGLSVSDDFNLTVAPETIAPTATITDNVPGTSIGTVLYTVTFSETVTGLAANDFAVTNGTVSSVTGSGTSYVVAVAPSANFEGTLALSLNAGAVLDKAGNQNASVAAAGQAVDTRKPVVTTITPTADSTGVAVATNITLAYSEAIRAGTGVIELRTAAGALIESFNVATSNRLTFAGSSLTVDPTALLSGATQYRLSVADGAVLDVAGNAAVALTTYTFTTLSAVNTINGTAAANTLNGTAGDDAIYGFGGNDTLNGNAGNDLLDGGTGNDRMTGGAGDDIYVVESANDTVTEAANGGTDTVRTTRASYTLANNVENLTYIGDATFSGTGNAANNSITGGIGNDTLDGRAGNDIMTGGLGNDRYVVDSSGDVVVEQSSEGNDMVTASMSYVLGANVENLTLSGNAALNGTGNAVANQITGNSGANILRGAGGADTLNGAGGTDTAAFDQAASSYALDHSGSAVIVSDLVNGEGTDTLTAIENLNFAGSNYAIVSGTTAVNTINGGAGSQAIFALGGNDIINGGAGNDIIVAGLGNDGITLASDTGGRDFIDGGAGEDTFTLATATGAEAFVIYTRTAALQALSGLTLNLNTEIVVTRNGVVIAELDNIEEIVVSSLRVTSPTGANGGTVAGDTIQVVGDFNQTSLNFNTITIDGTQANDVVDISALESAHRIVFTSNGGQDTVVGALRPQDIVNMGTGPTAAVDHAALAPIDTAMPAVVATPVVPTSSAALPTDDVVRGTVQRTVDDNPHADDNIHVDDKGGLRPQGVKRSDDVPGVDDHGLSHGKNDDDASKGRSSDDHGARHGQKTHDVLSIDPIPGNTASDRYYGKDGADLFKFRGGDTIHDFDDSDDIIDLRGLGVSRDNFKQMVSVSQDSAGLSLKIGDAIMRVLGEDDLSLSDFLFDAAGPAVDEPKRTSDLPTDSRRWDDNPKHHGIEDNLKVEDFMVPRWTVDADLVI